MENYLIVRRLRQMTRKDRADLKRKLLALFKRAEIKSVPKSKVYHNRTSGAAKYAKSLEPNISYRKLPTSEDQSRNDQTEPRPTIIGQKSGSALAIHPAIAPMVPASKHTASAETPRLISNAGELDIPDDAGVPDEYKFEIFRLRRRIAELECTVRDRDERNVRAISMLEDELQFWRTFMHDHVGDTHDGIQRRIVRIESTLLRLREKGSKFYPSLEIPDRWKAPDATAQPAKSGKAAPAKVSQRGNVYMQALAERFKDTIIPPMLGEYDEEK